MSNKLAGLRTLSTTKNKYIEIKFQKTKNHRSSLLGLEVLS